GDVQATGNVLAQLMRQQTYSLERQSVVLARQPGVKALIQTGDPATVTSNARQYMSELNADATLLTDRAGRVLGYADRWNVGLTDLTPDPAQLRSIAPIPGLQSALDGKPWRGVVSRFGTLVVQVTVPVTIGEETWGT